MAEIIMPKMGDAMTEGKVVRWYKKAGDAVKKGEPVLEIETDKVNLDLEAEQDGTVGEIAADEGQMVPVGGRLATILGAGEKAPAPSEPQRRATDKKDSVKHTTGEYAEAIETKGPRKDKSAPPETTAAARPPHSTEGRQRSSPLARRMARELGVDLKGVQGSGPQGRIIAKDVLSGGQALMPAGDGGQARVPIPQEQSIPLSAMRRTIAKRLSESIGPIPHFFLTADYDVENLVSLRSQIEEKTSINDFVVRAVALTLRKHPNVNASWGEEAITQHGEIHVGIAVSTPEGLITPVVRNADRKTVLQIAQEVRALAEKAKNRKLTPNEYQGSTFTISNLGAWGIEEFTAIINPPNVAILAVGAAEARPVVVEGQIVVRERMKVTMSCDHRVVDGAAGAEFLRTLRQYIEQPVRLFL
ncbi:MAG TPA: dihydrolipoamide acetyltransferase family protein [Thermoanaerobaculia bacterium]|jgi:pyruvate dehydrogenase E2 component (dihydrolipoamide acetyltransferase)